MIRFLTSAERTHTIADWLAGPGAGVAGRIQPVAYEAVLARPPDIVAGEVWVFSNYERLATDDALAASALWQKLSDGGCRMVNHPTRSMRRYELMRTLREARINAFNIYRVVDLRPPERYPVFLRRFDNHAGPATGLLADAAALEQAIEQAREDGWPMDWLAIVEYAETREADGLHRVRSALRIGELLMPIHVLARDHWVVKDGADCRWDAADSAVEVDHFERFPEINQATEVFRLARIDYGRIDYSRSGDGIQVWEIDPSPELFGPLARMPARSAIASRAGTAIAEAFKRLDGAAS